MLNTHTGQSADVCVSTCEPLYYRYALLVNGSECLCANEPGYFMLPANYCDIPCHKNAEQRCGGNDAIYASVYDTDVFAPGPPRALRVLRVTETSVRVAWMPPNAYSLITGYTLWAQVLHSFADVIPPMLEWRVTNGTMESELPSLHPGSRYLIGISAFNQEEIGPNITIEAETEIGTPDPIPPDIQIKERHGDRMVIHIPPAKNTNGPITKYRIVVSIELYQQGYILENLHNYTMAVAEHFPYYITAELDPEDIKNDFTIGDRHIYNGFYNAPLPLTNDVEISLGVVSEKNHVWKIRYADSKKKVILNINEPEEVSGLVVALGAAIAIGVVLLLIGIGALIILRKRIWHVRQQRSSQSMPLKLSEPLMEIENAGFLVDDDAKIDHYAELKRKLRTIPRDSIDIDLNRILGLGTYGDFRYATVCGFCDTRDLPSFILTVQDRSLAREQRRHMLRELDSLLRTTDHENVLSLLGICETPSALLVVLEDISQNLKDDLLNSRINPCNERFTSLREKSVLEWCAQVARGVAHLHASGVCHERLACRNISIVTIGGNTVARVTAPEIFRGAHFHIKADVWSFGCLVWEVVTLGGTPLNTVPSNELVARVQRGVRPAQPPHCADVLFQVCLDCWHTAPEERPAFSTLAAELQQLAERPSHATALQFNYYEGFQHEPYVPQSEFMLQ
ncbi:Putative tyrosine-protein kinase Wsck [Eumeta japonica]|uniref:Tyrosine-protein kinase Wsck n=1 Tax=Eumeta variegata TaxID=151549 RepID=A0A4C1WES3_EUMVA|nr:Putative tyrosine-protein kinase Wsck [Eumeta japonica]